MSGLLVTYSLMRELDRNKGRFNIALFYLHRFLRLWCVYSRGIKAAHFLIINSYRPSRLTPVYAIILGFIATLLAYLGSGPSWQNVRDLSVACRWNWWNNLLYVNNYVRSYELEASNRIYLTAFDRSTPPYLHCNIYSHTAISVTVYGGNLVLSLRYANVYTKSVIHLSSLAMEENWIKLGYI